MRQRPDSILLYAFDLKSAIIDGEAIVQNGDGSARKEIGAEIGAELYGTIRYWVNSCAENKEMNGPG